MNKVIERFLSFLTDIALKLCNLLPEKLKKPLSNREKLREVISYLFFGVLTTLVSLLTYWLMAKVLGNNQFTGDELTWRANLCQGFSWVCAVLFAFFTNRAYVFNTFSDKNSLFKEMGKFFLARAVSFILIEIGIFNLLLLLIRRDMPCKVITTILVVIFNYFASKFAVFTKKNISKKEKND